MSRSPNAKLVMIVVAGGLTAGCGEDKPEPWRIDPVDYDGLGEHTIPSLANPCLINTGASTMTLSVRGNETVYLTLRTADNVVIADGQTGGGAECAVPVTYKIAIVEDPVNTGVEKVFLDYLNGPFALGSTTAGVATAGITIALGAGSSLIVRGSSGADQIALGSTYASNVLAHSWININGDGSPDVRMDAVTDVVVTAGAGADIISADGGQGTTGTALDATIGFSAYGGPDADTLTGGKGLATLAGGDGNDSIVQTATIGSDIIAGGKGTDTVDYSARTVSVNVTICTTCAAAACAVCIGDDGASGEADTVHDDVEIVLGSKGNDTLSARTAVCSNAAASPTVLCTLKGNDGDDTLIGSAHRDLLEGGNGNDTLGSGLGNDTVIGGAGIDTVSYSDRSNAVKVSLDATKLWEAGQNGEPGENDSLATDIENLVGGAGDDFLRGSSAANIIRGGAGTDIIEGALGNDSLYGEADADRLYGSPGNDMLVGGAGADVLVGGDGDDFLDSSDSPATSDTTIDCDGVNDSADTAGTSPGTSDALVKDSSDTGMQHCEL